ncbi:ABC transporter permease [Jiangella ureilytica]|uniref:ABC transporter permease n=1 Tax=Jiangella ureilytica TaxID=2530374 RepID=A0A4V2XXD5_9ACTN|nr:ABC transporter permease [Jiangella ureilytica]TDC52755.1 ABC transporter permease [Jiangella ureilytica]
MSATKTPAGTDGRPADGPARPVRPRRRWRRAWRRHRLGVLGIVMASFVALSAIFGPIIVDFDPNEQVLTDRLLPPGTEGEAGYHLLGTDNLGRDVLARVLAGARASLGVVLAALILGAAIGVTLGAIAGFYSGWRDNLIMRVVDAQLALPTIIAALFIAAVLGTGYWNTALTLGVTSWPAYARLMRAEVLRIREEDYIDASIGLGAPDRNLIRRHVFPNLVSSLCVVASLELGRTVLTESSLSYLGFGMQPPDASWGSMIRDGQAYIFEAPWLATVPGVYIMLTVLGMNLLGDWLRDVLDPHHE